jgi:hypothetical protein
LILSYRANTPNALSPGTLWDCEELIQAIEQALAHRDRQIIALVPSWL